MKASVITLHTVCNYGTQLQAFATQEKLKQYFDDVEFIDYRRPDTYGINLLKTFTKGNPIKAIAILPTIIKWKFVFGNFQKNNLKISKNKYLSNDDLKKYKDTSDVYFTGSDQVWNTGWNNGILEPMYLNFIPDSKPRYSFAASFGINKLSKEEVKQSEKLIKKYKKITVREESGLTILKEQYKYNNCERILDPTLSLSAEFWRKYSTKRKIKKPYILIYNLNRNKEFDKYAKELSEKTGYKLYRFCTRFDQIFRNGKSLLIPEIFDFITLVDNAEFVVTDSFHATAFSMNLNTRPICLYPNNYFGRLSEFLKLVNSEDVCHPKDYNDFSIINKKVDFNKVNTILDNERTKIDDFLQEIVEKEGESI